MNIDRDTTVRGSFQVEGDLRVEGTLEGKVFVTGRIILVETGVITGEVKCSGGTVSGRFSGVLHSDEPVDVDPKARVAGRIVAPALDFSGAEAFEMHPPGPGVTFAEAVSTPPVQPSRHPIPQEAEPAPAPSAHEDRPRTRRAPRVTGDRSQVLVEPSAIVEQRR